MITQANFPPSFRGGHDQSTSSVMQASAARSRPVPPGTQSAHQSMARSTTAATTSPPAPDALSPSQAHTTQPLLPDAPPIGFGGALCSDNHTIWRDPVSFPSDSVNPDHCLPWLQMADPVFSGLELSRGTWFRADCISISCRNDKGANKTPSPGVSVSSSLRKPPGVAPPFPHRALHA